MATTGPYRIKRNDTEPPVTGTLKNGNQLLDLSGAIGLKFIMRVRGAQTAKVNAAATILQAGSVDVGRVQYDWVTGDTDTAGVYDAEFEINWGGGRKQTVPNEDYQQVIVLSDLA